MHYEIDYTPRWYQWELHEKLERFNVLVVHRRAGKTVLAINQLIKDIIECQLRRPYGAYVAPLYTQAKKVAWEYLKEFTKSLPGVSVNESELRVDLYGGRRIQLFGSDNPDSMRGMYFDSVVLDEVAQMSPRTWSQVIRPALADRKGKAIFIGTPQGKSNIFYEFYQRAATMKGWYRRMLTVDDTNELDPEELEAAKREMSIDEYNQEFHCSWDAAIKGSYYGSELGLARLQKRVTSVPYEPQVKVFTAWDLGLADSTAIWFAQVIGRELRIIGYMEFTGIALLDIIKEVLLLPYIYDQHFAPHDIKVRELSTGRSRLQIARAAGINFVVTKNIHVKDGIEAGRVMMRRAYIDEDACQKGLSALEQYKRKWDEKTQSFAKHPLHDWTSHGADAWRYLAVNFDSMIRPQMNANKPKVIRGMTK